MQFDTGDPDYFQTQLELLKSRTLAERVVAQMKLKPAAVTAPPPRPWWEELFRKENAAGRAAVPGGGQQGGRAQRRGFAPRRTGRDSRSRTPRWSACRIASANPRLAADVLNALAQNFINFNLEQRYDQSSYAKTFLEEKLAETKAKLETNERALIDFQRDNAIVNGRRPADGAFVDADRLQHRGQQGGAGPRAGPSRSTSSSRPIRSRRRRCSRARRCRR